MLEKGMTVMLENGDIDIIARYAEGSKVYSLEHHSGIFADKHLTPMSDEEIKAYSQDLKFQIGDIVVEVDKDADTPFAKDKVRSGIITAFAVEDNEVYYKIGQGKFYLGADISKALVQSEEEYIRMKRKGEKVISEMDILKYVQIPKERHLNDIYLDDDIKRNILNFKEYYFNRNNIKESGFEDIIRFTILLAGPPGNGKSVLASAIAKELGLKCYLADASKLRTSLNGETGKNIGRLFDAVRQAGEDGCVLFLDECDSVATKRTYLHGADKDDSSSLNVILTKMDSLGDNIIVIAATNYKDELDAAFARRFTLTLYLDKPENDNIAKYVNDYLAKYKEKAGLDYDETEADALILKSYGNSWSRIEEICRNFVMKKVFGSSMSIDNGWVGLKEHKAGIGFLAR